MLQCPVPRAGTYVNHTAPRTCPQADERRVTFGFFGFGLICFHVTAILFSILNLKTESAAVVSIILGVFMLAFYTNTKRIYNRMVSRKRCHTSNHERSSGATHPPTHPPVRDRKLMMLTCRLGKWSSAAMVSLHSTLCL